jgi:cysteine desulfurase family protein (TIGR01976 family)
MARMTTSEDVRARFPGLSDGWVRFDGPAGTLPVDSSVDAIADYMRSPSPANLGGRFDASIASDAVVARARESAARLVGAQPDEIVFGPSTTNLMFAFTRALSRVWQPGDRIVCTQLDHDSNIAPWLLAARDVGATVELLEVDPVDGTLDVEPLKELCADGRTRWVAISGASNLTGHVPDLARATAIAHEHGARILVDGVARVPHLPTDAAALGVDVLSTSPYKWYGPHAGVLAVRNDLLREVEPYRVRPADYDGPARWETGTPQIELLAGITAAAEFMLGTPLAEEAERETRLLALLQEGLHDIPGVTVHGPSVTPDRAPTLIFTVAGHTPDEVDRYLASRRIAVWSGDNYARELIDALGLRATGGAVRAGIVRYTTADDVAALLDALAGLTSRVTR